MSCLQIDYENILGSGAYGVVLKGSIKGTNSTEALDVAVKMVKPDTDIEYFKALLAELKVMVYIGQHNQIAELIGAVTTKITENEIFVVLKFYPNGSLKDYLKNNSNLFVHKPDDRQNLEENPDYTNCYSVSKTIKQHDLVQWSYEIATGMDYLVSKKVIHGDIAARNILLDKNRYAKISDFGLARQLHNYSVYVKKSQVPLPWRWMSFEAICDMTFSHKSDVWAFGVTVWEIFSLGDLPYPATNFDGKIIKFLKTGHRLSKPDLASQEIYDCIMHPTWNLDPEARPPFLELSKTLKTLLQSEFSQSDINESEILD